MRKYAIWDKQSPIITPIGEVLSAEQWIERYPVAGVPSIIVVCSAGEVNGGFFGTLGQMMQMYEDEVDFSQCETAEEALAMIEAYDEAKNAESTAKATEKAETEAFNSELTATSLASIAASMEYQNMMTLPDEEV